MFRYTALLSFCGLLASCQDCPLIGCDSALEVSIGNSQYPLDLDVHVVELELDGQAYAVVCRPQSACLSEDMNPLYPVRGEFTDGIIELEVANGGNAPETVNVRLSLNDELLLEEEVTPSYEERSRTGDEACGVCLYTEEPLEFVVDQSLDPPG